VSGDLAQHVHGDAGVGHPGQAGVSEAVTTEVLVTETAHNVVPVGRVAKDRGGDATTSWSGEKASLWLSSVRADPA
jgi:hypothetical protein